MVPKGNHKCPHRIEAILELMQEVQARLIQAEIRGMQSQPISPNSHQELGYSRIFPLKPPEGGQPCGHLSLSSVKQKEKCENIKF